MTLARSTLRPPPAPRRRAARSRAWTLAAAALLAVGLGLPSSRAEAQEDPLRPIAADVRRGADPRALSALADLGPRVQGTARARYLRGRLLERLGRLSEAAEAYPVGSEAAALPDAVRADARRRRAIALSRTGRCEEARQLFAPDAADPLIEARVAECSLATGETDRAAAELREVVRRSAAEVDLFAARFALAEALARSAQRDEAAEVLTELIVERVEHPQAAQAEAALRALLGRDPELSFAQRMRRADRLIDVRRHDDAIAEIRSTERPASRAELRRYLHLLGVALYRQRHSYEEAARVLAQSAELSGSHAAEDRFHAARALSRADRDAEAVRAYRRFAREHPDHRRAPEAVYLAAWLELRHDMAGGERNMSRFVRSRLAARAPRLAREATWQLALRAFERGRHRRAATLFSRYATLNEGPLVRARGLYWTGRARQARGDRAAAIDAYRQALYVEPLHWYALLARQRLEALGEPTPSPFPEPPQDGAGAAPTVQLPEEVAFYADLGLRVDARDALRGHEAELRRMGGSRAVVEAYRRLGEPSRPVRMFGGPSTTRRSHRPGPADLWRWRAAYPRPWPETARAAAESVGLTPSHLYAVMRQESGFDPDAVSYADAIGLMQLLPRTAARMGERLGLEVTRQMLFDPAVNVRLGAAYVGGLAERFGVPLAFAAFNAGGHRVRQWLQEQGRTELDLFVEHIPFAQTRNYVRRVTTHLAHYRFLEDLQGGWPLTLPSHVAPAGR